MLSAILEFDIHGPSSSHGQAAMGGYGPCCQAFLHTWCWPLMGPHCQPWTEKTEMNKDRTDSYTRYPYKWQAYGEFLYYVLGKSALSLYGTYNYSDMDETKYRHRCQRRRQCTLICEYLGEFLKKIKKALRELAGGQRKVKTEKNSEEKKKISWHCSFSYVICTRVNVTCKATTSLKVWKQFGGFWSIYSRALPTG